MEELAKSDSREVGIQEKRQARLELFRLTDEELFPDWYKDLEKIKRRDKLMRILERQAPLVESEESKYRRYQQYLDKRPGMEEKIVAALESGKNNRAIYGIIGVKYGQVIAHVRKKYGIDSLHVYDRT